MGVFDQNDYRAILRERIASLRSTRPAMTMKAIASRVPIQYTYLSRALRNESVHLGEDDLFTLCRLVELPADAAEYVTLLRAREMAKSAARREFLDQRLSAMRRTRQMAAKLQDFKTDRVAIDSAYLFDPTAVLVHVSLFIPEYAANPRRLAAPLGLSPKRLDHVLKTLADAGFAEPGENGTWRPLKGSMHYGPNHPLTRAHQALCKTAIAARLAQTNEENKNSFMTTFAADEETFQAIGERFRVFLAEVEALAKRSRPKATYQMTLDLLRWL